MGWPRELQELGFRVYVFVLLYPQAAHAFLQQSGLQALEKHQEETQLHDRIHALRQTTAILG